MTVPAQQNHEAPLSKQDFRLIAFIEKCHRKGVITDRQRNALDGVTTRTDPRRILQVLVCKR